MDGSVSGLLKLEVDTERKTCNEIFYKQYHRDGYWARSDVLSEILDLPYDSMIITYNGRVWDLAYLIHSLGICDNADIREKIASIDRDLMCTYLARRLSIKGGLYQAKEDIFKELENKKLQLNEQLILNYKKCEKTMLTNHRECEDGGPSSWSFTEIYTDKVRKPRNEMGIRILPIVEEYLGLLYLPRIREDIYFGSWVYQKRFVDKMGKDWINWNCC
jgi:hypothetical protein